MSEIDDDQRENEIATVISEQLDYLAGLGERIEGLLMTRLPAPVVLPDHDPQTGQIAPDPAETHLHVERVVPKAKATARAFVNGQEPKPEPVSPADKLPSAWEALRDVLRGVVWNHQGGAPMVSMTLQDARAIQSALARVEGEPDVCGCDELRSQLARVIRERSEAMIRAERAEREAQSHKEAWLNTKAHLEKAERELAEWNRYADAVRQPPGFYKNYSEGTMRAMQALMAQAQEERDALRKRLRKVVHEVTDFLRYPDEWMQRNMPTLAEQAALLAEARPEKEPVPGPDAREEVEP